MEELIAGPSGQIEGLYPVQDAGPNACPPMVVGVGIGGTFEKCALMAKDALTREVGTHTQTSSGSRIWKRRCLRQSISLVSDLEVLEEQQQLLR